MMRRRPTAPLLLLILLPLGLVFWLTGSGVPAAPAGAAAVVTRQVNMPYLPGTPPADPAIEPAIFWFGQVGSTSNYADVRAHYNDDEVRITLHVFDRALWYDTTPAANDLVNWDAVSLYVDTAGAAGDAPRATSYRFDAQLSHWQARTGYEAGFQGNGSAWSTAADLFSSSVGWRGNGFNDSGFDRGWHVTFALPFASLGLAEPPAAGTLWGLGIQLHDRDSAGSNEVAQQVWPAQLNNAAPATWGRARFGLPPRVHPPGVPEGIITVRQGLNGGVVADAHVGGHTDCGAPFAADYFGTWGAANYAGAEIANVQNQWDVADWPCFSKYFVTFPLDPLPAGAVVLQATLTLHQIGTLGDSSERSWLQLLTIGEPWSEATLTWNNAPPATENLTGAWLNTLPTFPGWPGVAHQWDVTGATTEALAGGRPLRLALYSADGDYHSGKHLVTSDTGDWNAVARPTLQIVYGTPCSAGADVCRRHYLPTARR